MRKIFFILITVCSFLGFSCQEPGISLQEEKLTLQLPAWPPQSHYQTTTITYPPLSRWKITIKSHTLNQSYYLSPEEKSLSITAEKNQPLSVTALPITKNSSNQETIFFKPAGFIYPYNYSQDKMGKLTWEEGFMANIMEKLISNGNKVGTFNWKKASNIVKEKIINEDEPYNPWLLNQQNIMEKITSKKFSSTYLNLTSTLLHKTDTFYLSSFIPNNFSKAKNQDTILLKKYSPELFYSSQSEGFIFTYDSTKKVSQEHIFLPIYIEEL